MVNIESFVFAGISNHEDSQCNNIVICLRMNWSTRSLGLQKTSHLQKFYLFRAQIFIYVTLNRVVLLGLASKFPN